MQIDGETIKNPEAYVRSKLDQIKRLTEQRDELKTQVDGLSPLKEQIGALQGKYEQSEAQLGSLSNKYLVDSIASQFSGLDPKKSQFLAESIVSQQGIKYNVETGEIEGDFSEYVSLFSGTDKPQTTPPPNSDVKPKIPDDPREQMFLRVENLKRNQK